MCQIAINPNNSLKRTLVPRPVSDMLAARVLEDNDDHGFRIDI